jgi:hypothetical protein
MQRLKMYLQVTAGIIPGEPMPEYSKRWEWSPAKVEGARVEMTAEELLQFHELSDEAHAYAKELQNPGFTNWVTTEWVWL